MKIKHLAKGLEQYSLIQIQEIYSLEIYKASKIMKLISSWWTQLAIWVVKVS